MRVGIPSKTSTPRCEPSGKGQDSSIFTIILASTIFGMFAPSLFVEFGFHNDYSVFSYDHRRALYPETQYLFSIGRPLGAVLLNWQFYFAHSMRDLAILRGLSTITLIAVFLITAKIFGIICPARKRLALIVSFLIAVLPSFILNVAWAGNFVPGIVNILLAAVSYYAMVQSYQSSRSSDKVKYLTMAGFLLFSTFLIYPPTSYYFLVFTVWRILSSSEDNWDRNRKRAILEIGLVVVLTGFYFVFIELSRVPLTRLVFGPEISSPFGPYQVALVSALADKLLVMKDYFLTSSELWFADMSKATAYVIILALVLGLWARSNRPGGFKFEAAPIERVGLSILCLLLSSTTVALSKGGFVAFRTIPATAAIFVVAFMFSVSPLIVQYVWFRRSETKIVVLVGAIAVVSVLGLYRVISIANNENAELRFVREAIETANPFERVIVFQPPQGDVIVGDRVLTRDLRFMATNFTLIPGIFAKVLREHRLRDTIRIVDAPWEPRMDLVTDPSDFKLDMVRAGFRSGVRESSGGRRFTSVVSVSPMSGCCSPVAGFVPSSRRLGCCSPLGWFWESDASFPVTMTIHRIGTCLPISKYSFKAFLLPDRMPASWKVSGRWGGSEDWRLIDSRNGIAFHGDFEEQTFELNKTYCLQDVRFIFFRSGDGLLRIGRITF